MAGNTLRLTASVWLGVALGIGGCDLDPDNFQCERAVTHLERCCDDLDVAGACGSAVLDGLLSRLDAPVLTESEAECVLARSCDTLEDVCASVQARVNEDTGTWSDSGLHWEPLPLCSP
jgi:hypothetical protein